MGLVNSPSWILSSLLIVVPCVLICMAMVWIVRRQISLATLRKHHDVAGFTFSIIGVLYSVILGFTVVNVQTRYNEAAQAAYSEATMLYDLYRDADYFSPESRSAIHASLREYVQYVINEEWNMPNHSNRRLKSDVILRNIWDTYATINLENEKTKIWYEQAIGKLDQLMNVRLARELYSWEHLSSMMWTVLLTGAVVTLAFMFLFGLESLKIQMLITGLLAGYLSFTLFLVFSLDHIFKGSQQLQPVALEQTLILFDRLDQKG